MDEFIMRTRILLNSENSEKDVWCHQKKKIFTYKWDTNKYVYMYINNTQEYQPTL